jgi:glutaconyl-CoA/methylmalonyl-CoA decarboxylase subunit delta
VELLPTGITISLLGIALVFALLAALWGLVALLLRTDRGEAPAPAVAEAATLEAAPAAAGAAPELTPALLTAVTVAVLTHRTFLRRQAAPAARSHQPGALLHASRWVASGRTRQNRSWQPRRG